MRISLRYEAGTARCSRRLLRVLRGLAHPHRESSASISLFGDLPRHLLEAALQKGAAGRYQSHRAQCLLYLAAAAIGAQLTDEVGGAQHQRGPRDLKGLRPWIAARRCSATVGE